MPAELLGAASVVKKLNGLLARPFVGHEVKEAMRSLLPLGIDLTGLEMDTGVAAYLLDASTGDYQLAQLREQTGQLSLDIVEPGETERDLAKDAAGEAADVAGMAQGFRRRIVAEDMEQLHDDIETPLVRVLAKMEVAGIGVDRPELQKITDALKEAAASLQAEVQEHAGREFNVNSTPQLRTVLYEELGLTPGKKTKTGFSTDAQTLESLRGRPSDHRRAAGLPRGGEAALDLRREPAGRDRAGRAHPRLASGRRWPGPAGSPRTVPICTTSRCAPSRASSSGAPSCRRRAPASSWPTTTRWSCAASPTSRGTPASIDALTTGSDVHRTVAAAVYGIAPEEVSHTQREYSKMVSYGLAYGMEAYGLSQRLGVPVEEAAAIMESYFGAFPLVKQYMDHAVADAKIAGATRTLFGRIRPLPDLLSSNYRVRQAAERQAMNAGIQGLAADIFKLALVRLDRDLEAEKLASRLVLQVHDEVIVEVAPGEEEDVRRLTESALTGAADLRVPLDHLHGARTELGGGQGLSAGAAASTVKRYRHRTACDL